ncbi:putative ybl66, partial [Escherichia coli 90.2281]
KVW